MKLALRSEFHRQGHYVAPARTLIFAGLFLLIFGVVGAWSFIRSLEPLTWKSVPCTVTQFTLTDDPKSDTPFGANVEFRFELDGRTYQGSKLGIPGWKKSRDQIRHTQRFKNQQQATCYLPNGKPESAVLLRPSSQGAGLAFIAFAVIVGWILYQAHIHRDESTGKLSRKLMPALALLFGTPGLFMLFFLSLPVWIESIQVRSWKETPATVIWSEIRMKRNSKSTNYRADICYEYHANGRKFRQNQLYPGNLDGVGSSSAEKLVHEYPPGAVVTCHVHPQAPERSVLIPKVGWALLLTLFPLPFLGVGMYLIWLSFSGEAAGSIMLCSQSQRIVDCGTIQKIRCPPLNHSSRRKWRAISKYPCGISYYKSTRNSTE